MMRHDAWGFDSDRDEDWRANAACRPGSGIDSELFFPVGEGTAARYQAVAAKRVCARCHVVADCDAWVREHPQTDGIYAGMTPEERRAGKSHGRMPTCRHGHELTADNIYRRPDGKSGCRRCVNTQSADCRARKRQREREQRDGGYVWLGAS